MTKKTFVKVAKDIRAIVDAAGKSKIKRNQARQQADYMAELFGNENPRFDRSRFLAACGFSY